MKRLPIIAIASLALAPAACVSPTATGVAGMCAAGVLINDAFYGAAGTPETSLPAGLVADDLLGRVAAYDPTCYDVIDRNDPPDPMQNWESNTFPVGTPIYSLRGVPPTDRLAARLDSAWVILLGPDFAGDGA